MLLFFIFIQIKSVQTFLAHKASNYLSQKLNTRVEIESVEIHFLKSIVLNKFYIEDLHRDTLLYSEELEVNIKKLDFDTHQLFVKNIALQKTKLKLQRHKSDDDLNLQFIIDAFDAKDTLNTKDEMPWLIKCDKVDLLDVDFVYRDEHDTSTTTGINYYDLNARKINALFRDVYILKDSILGTIDNLSAREKSGFVLENLSAYATVNPSLLKLGSLKIKTPNTEIIGDVVFKYNGYKSFNNFIGEVKINALLEESHIQIADVAYFAPELKNIQEDFKISGNVSGYVSDLKGKKINLKIGDNTTFLGDITLTGLPKIEDTFIYLNIEKLTTNYKDLKQFPIPPFEQHKTLDVPVNLAKLGIINFKGTFTGLYNDFYAYGTLSSALGILSSDLSVRHNVDTKKQFYKGKLKSIDFNFGQFFDVPTLGKATMNVEVDGSGLASDQILATLRGAISSVEFNKYTYRNIVIEGSVAKEIFKGKLNVKDENIDFDFIGNVDFSKSLPRLDFVTTLNNADLAALHFVNTTKKTNLSTQIIIDVTGSNIDNLIGQINFDNTIYKEGNETYKMSVFNLLLDENKGTKSIQLFSDFVDAKLIGRFKILELESEVEKVLSNYIPTHFKDKSSLKKSTPQNFEYSFLFKKTDPVMRLFAPAITIAPKTYIHGRINTLNRELSLYGESSKLSFSGVVFKNWNASSKSTNEDLLFDVTCQELFLTDSLSLNDFSVNTKTNDDSVNLSITWDNKLAAKKYKGDIKSFLHFNTNNSVLFKILPSYFILSDSLWNIHNTNAIRIDSSRIAVDDLMFEHQNQLVSLNGILSHVKTDQLRLNFSNFNLANLNLFTRSSGFIFNGILNGTSTVTDVYHDLIFSSKNHFKSLFINNNALGDGDVESVWDNYKEALYMHGQFTLAVVPNILFSGYYYPNREQDNVDIELNLQALQMQLFEPFVKDYCSDFKGLFSGNVNIKGSLKEPKVFGNINVDAQKVTVAYLNTSYRFSHNILIENNSFGIENMVIYDINNNKAIVTGKVYHDNFQKYQLDFDIQTSKFMCLNTAEVDNNLYYGKAFTTGIVNIFGFIDNILIDANLKTEKIVFSEKADKLNVIANALSKTEYTKLFIPLGGTTEVEQNNFITFVKKDSVVDVDKDYKVQLGGLALNLNLDVTSDAEIQLIFDQQVGDVIKSRGNGNINLNISSTGDFKMYGDYVIESGDYLFTLQNVINKKFDLEKGGVIKWSGIPYKADLNINAVYKARASLQPFLFDSTTTTSVNLKKRYPVDLKLKMTKELLSPEINFDIDLPTVDPEVRQTVLSYINNEAEVNRQVFSLLILNSFVTPYQLANVAGGPGVGSAAGNNTSEMLSNQLSNMLSKISNDFDIGVNYRPGDIISSKELNLALSTQLFNDKVSVEGNIGNNTSTQSTNNIVGDVNIDYKLTDDGKFRIKAFNKANDNNQTNLNGAYTQGVGIFYREEFNTIGELYRQYLETLKRLKNKSQKNKAETLEEN